jgi:hypothetical protein
MVRLTFAETREQTEECWSNPASANKTPSWWSKKQEVANTGADEEPKLRYSLMGIC